MSDGPPRNGYLPPPVYLDGMRARGFSRESSGRSDTKRRASLDQRTRAPPISSPMPTTSPNQFPLEWVVKGTRIIASKKLYEVDPGTSGTIWITFDDGRWKGLGACRILWDNGFEQPILMHRHTTDTLGLSHAVLPEWARRRMESYTNDPSFRHLQRMPNWLADKIRRPKR